MERRERGGGRGAACVQLGKAGLHSVESVQLSCGGLHAWKFRNPPARDCASPEYLDHVT